MPGTRTTPFADLYAEDYFADSLTYLCEHNEEGAMGIMINRPSSQTLPELMEQLGIKPTNHCLDVPVYEGGPVAIDHGYVIHSADMTLGESAPVGNNLFMTTATDMLEAIAAGRGPASFLVALGYAGWGAGQLEAEISSNFWLSAPATEELLFATPPVQRIGAAARLLGLDFGLVARTGNA